ncbi:NUDIX hydrolase [Streptomyces sp. NPDC004539]|uniref:NUDIX hydrolase n=1 Tax=Streptomyces sp. NPDC004539 TaxID=3154280 RepID=UPI0033A60383
MRKTRRTAAYAVVVENDRILLARFRNPDGTGVWVMPGGGVEHGEDPYDAVIRELREETGYEVEVTALLGVHSRRISVPRDGLRGPADHHGMAVVYEAKVVGGDLRPEENGSTDLAAWHDLADLSSVETGSMVEKALALWRDRPVTGHLAPPKPAALLALEAALTSCGVPDAEFTVRWDPAVPGAWTAEREGPLWYAMGSTLTPDTLRVLHDDVTHDGVRVPELPELVRRLTSG